MEMASNVYTNEGFAPDDNNINNSSSDQKHNNDNINSNNNNAVNNKPTSTSGNNNHLKHSNTNSSLNNASGTTTTTTAAATEHNMATSGEAGKKTIEDEASSAHYYSSSKKDGGGGGGGSAVDFTLPSGVKGRERSKSILSDGPYRGMGKEELLRFSSRPLWRNLRYACMSIILTGWLALLITVVALVLTYPHCRDPQRKDWWQKTVVYRVYVRSFMDYSHNDGIGDIQGLIHKLDYLKDTGVGTISLSPIYRLSPNAPSDTHIVNHTEIDPVFGTMEEFNSLVNETHNRGMHLILDFIPNHTSDQHPWFRESKVNSDPRENVYRSYYVWQQGIHANLLGEPNSWQSVYNCRAWSFTTNKNNFYLHQFMETQPDLNLRSEKVRVELEAILQFWLDLGVDGFNIRDADYLFEDYDLRDDVLEDNSTTLTDCKTSSTGPVYPYDSYSHHYTKGLTELFDMLARWRAFLDDYGNKTRKYKLLIADVDASYDHVMHYYGLFNRDGVDLPFNRFSLNLTEQGNAEQVAAIVDNWMSRLPTGRWASWMGGDDHSNRLADRLGPHMSMPYLIMTMLLPGTPYLYYGDEIGMRQSVVNASLVVPGGLHLPTRGPMLWDDKNHAGFCEQYCQQPWMAPYAGYKTENINVDAQQNDPYSMWHLFKNLTQLRKDYPSFEYGDYVKSIQDEQVFSFVREFDGQKGFLVALNFADEKVKRHFTGTHHTIPSGGEIEIVSGRTSRRRGNNVDLDPLSLEPHQGIVVSWDYVAEEI